MTKLYEILKKHKKFAIAFSGGVDSTFLAAVAQIICPNSVIAITADCAFQPREELQKALKIAVDIGILHIIVKVDVMSISKITLNAKDRCYFCKKLLFGELKQKAAQLGFDTLLHGANIDDLNDYRPGLKAAQEMGILAPLVEAQMTKSQIREASKEMGLSTWNIPSQSCLATRIPYGETITAQKLILIESCEQFLNSLGFYGIRVRCHTYHPSSFNNNSSNCSTINPNYIARIECQPQSIALMAQNGVRQKITSFFKEHGFRFVSLDLAGYSSGNMN
ncbi:MAG: ATP-dependent sacrificial sulfur transferase LarE [Desulfamplus sp.]|nr:ATP-dependent sacrificial sulfur transferase LarE [Desulfamplus sp.]